MKLTDRAGLKFASPAASVLCLFCLVQSVSPGSEGRGGSGDQGLRGAGQQDRFLRFDIERQSEGGGAMCRSLGRTGAGFTKKMERIAIERYFKKKKLYQLTY